jgi:hypothetical protein
VSSYSQKLKHPKWQKKRLEILNRDNFTCQSCKSEDKTLHIHHFEYDNVEPWEYENNKLITLCEDCHKQEEFLKEFTGSSYEYLARLGFLRNDLALMVCMIGVKADGMNDIEMREYFNKVKLAIFKA